MNSSFTDMLPVGLQMYAAILAGVSALLGLLLWSAGIRVARPLMAAFIGTALAGVGMAILPGALGISAVSSGLIGLAAGVLIGAVAFRFLQGAALAACLGVAACGAYYQVEMHRLAAAGGARVQPASMADLQGVLTKLPASPSDAKKTIKSLAPQAVVNDAARTATARWQSIPPAVRQQMLVLGFLVAVLTLVIAWLMPKYITWVSTSALGAGLLVVGGLFLLWAYVPGYQYYLPAAPQTRAGLLAAMVLGGMLVQHRLFWRRRMEGGQHAGETAAV